MANGVNLDLLQILREQFVQAELTKPINLERRFDLAMSLEIAEHPPESCAADFVNFLTSMADVVLFSATIPFQDGCGRENEQWLQFWADLFAGFSALDFIREHIWEDSIIPIWYRQSTFLYAKHPETPKRPDRIKPMQKVHGRVHPEEFMQSNRKLRSVKGWSQHNAGSIKRKIAR